MDEEEFCRAGRRLARTIAYELAERGETKDQAEVYSLPLSRRLGIYLYGSYSTISVLNFPRSASFLSLTSNPPTLPIMPPSKGR